MLILPKMTALIERENLFENLVKLMLVIFSIFLADEVKINQKN